jgi:hypothetical protein
MRAKQHQALLRRAVEAIWNQGELDVADVLFATTYVNHNGLIPDAVRGPEAIKLSVALYRTAFPDLRITVEDLKEDGDTVRLRWTARGAAPADRGCDASPVHSGRAHGNADQSYGWRSDRRELGAVGPGGCTCTAGSAATRPVTCMRVARRCASVDARPRRVSLMVGVQGTTIYEDMEA